MKTVMRLLFVTGGILAIGAGSDGLAQPATPAKATPTPAAAPAKAAPTPAATPAATAAPAKAGKPATGKAGEEKLMEFEGDVVEAQFLRPDQGVTEAVVRRTRSSLIQVRTDFVDEILKSAEDL
jgi:hypothetical protein